MLKLKYQLGVKTKKKRSFIKTELRYLKTKANTYYVNPPVQPNDWILMKNFKKEID